MFSPVRRPRRADAIATPLVLLLTSLCAGLVSACPNDVRDAHCTPDDPNAAADPDCIYAGEAKGPKYVEGLCPPIEGETPPICPDFQQVFELLVDPAKGNCSAGGCHGVAPGSLGFFFPANDPCAFYTQLVSINMHGQRYVVPDDPATPDNETKNSYIQCNLRGTPGGGYPMPIPAGMPNLADVALVDRWLLCGAPGPSGEGGGVPTTCIDAPGGGDQGGGGMGMGGMGGEGGMGGGGGN